MSDLQTVCRHLAVTSHTIARVSAELGGCARALRTSSARVATAAASAGADRASLLKMARRLDVAAGACQAASAVLRDAAGQGRGFVERTAAGSASDGLAGGSSEVPAAAAGPAPVTRAAVAAGPAGGGWSADQQAFAASAVPTPAGVAFYSGTETDMRDSALRLPPYPGEMVLDLHGTVDRVQLGDGPIELDARGFAEVVRRSGWTGQPVRLFSCSTGAQVDGFAQQLADELSVRVTAPTKPVWSNGSVTVGDPVWIVDPGSGRPHPVPSGPTGEWRELRPRPSGPSGATEGWGR